MHRWLPAALDYISQWLVFQMRQSEQPGCIIAIAHRDRVVLEQALGSADLLKGEPLTPRHRFRIASHSKSFTAAGILKLRERGRIRLDNTVGQYVTGLHRDVGQATIAQVLSHSAGTPATATMPVTSRIGAPFPSVAELRQDRKLASRPKCVGAMAVRA